MFNNSTSKSLILDITSLKFSKLKLTAEIAALLFEYFAHPEKNKKKKSK